MSQNNIEMEPEWSCIMDGVTKLKKILEGDTNQSFDSEEYVTLYGIIYDMCIGGHKDPYQSQLYDMYRKVMEDYIDETVLPSLVEKHGEDMLKELAKRWANHKVMVKWLSRFFKYLDRYYIQMRCLPTLAEVGNICFRDRVYCEMQSKATEAVLALIHRERECGQIDKTLLKTIVDIYVEIGDKGKPIVNMEKYEEDFERFMLEETSSYYSRKASSWIQEDSCPEYMIKCEESLKKEKERVSQYLHRSTEPKLVEILQNELLVAFTKQLIEKENSGCLALLREHKMDDLSRMYRLYHPIPKGLEPIAEIFKQYVTSEGIIFIQQAEDASTNQAASTGDVQEQERILIRKLTELHDKSMVFVTECFQDDNLFHKALKEAFEIICNKTMIGISSAEIIAKFCDNIPKNGESDEKLE